MQIEGRLSATDWVDREAFKYVCPDLVCERRKTL
jgi:hypothetical protein